MIFLDVTISFLHFSSFFLIKYIVQWLLGNEWLPLIMLSCNRSLILFISCSQSYYLLNLFLLPDMHYCIHISQLSIKPLSLLWHKLWFPCNVKYPLNLLHGSVVLHHFHIMWCARWNYLMNSSLVLMRQSDQPHTQKNIKIHWTYFIWTIWIFRAFLSMRDLK